MSNLTNEQWIAMAEQALFSVEAAKSEARRANAAAHAARKSAETAEHAVRQLVGAVAAMTREDES